MAFESILSADGATPAIQGMAPLVLAGLVVLFYVFRRGALFPGLPLIRLDDKAPTSLSAAQKEWNADAHEIIRKGLEQVLCSSWIPICVFLFLRRERERELTLVRIRPKEPSRSSRPLAPASSCPTDTSTRSRTIRT